MFCIIDQFMSMVIVINFFRSPSLHFIPQDYLEGVLTEVKTGLGETFCVTRRSAGMPFIIQVNVFIYSLY